MSSRSRTAATRWLVALSVLFGGCLTLAGPPALATTATPSPARVVFRLQDPALDESSGLAVSRRHPGIVWTHNDGGSQARVVALDRRGRSTAVLTLRGIDPFDLEALAPGKDARGGAALFLGDIGDNSRVRRDVSVFRFREPHRLRSQVVPAEWFRLRYPDGAHDAEALLVDPRDNRLWIATKDLLGGGLYRAPDKLSTQETNVLERVADVPGLITDGAFLVDGRFVLRSYATVYLYDAPGRLRAQAPLPAQEQGESVAVDGNRLLVGSEGSGSAVYAVPVPRVASPPESPPPSSPPDPPTSPTSTSAGDGAGSRSGFASPSLGETLRVGALGFGVVAVILLTLSRRRSRARRRR